MVLAARAQAGAGEWPRPDTARAARPGEMPEGVLFIVGSRTLDPLRPEARQQVHERRALVDLGQHLLSPASVIDICRRTLLTTALEPEIHQLIAKLSGGHPLALGYLLNRLRDGQGESAAEILAAVPAYSGDVAGEYRAVWDEIEDDDDIVEILAVCSRLRVRFTTEWLSSWAPTQAVRTFQRRLLYLFRWHHDGWRFFHDSFRQFAADQTAFGDDGPGNVDRDIRAHRRVAEICAETADPKMAAEQLYHRYHARESDAVLALAPQVIFREQYRQLRAPGLIRDDIALALDVAAECADVLAIVRLLLALTEVNERTSALENVNMPALLYEAGRVDEAIAFCGGETLDVPLAQAYDLAAILGEASEPAGRRLFDLIEHHGFDDPTRVGDLARRREAECAWARAAVLFRPIRIVLAAVRSLAEPRSDNDGETDFLADDRWQHHSRVMGVLIEESVARGDEATLGAIDTELKDLAALLQKGDGVPRGQLETVMDLRVRANAALLAQMPDPEAAEAHLSEIVSSVRGVSLFATTLLEVAELLASHGLVDQAAELLDRLPFDDALTAARLSDSGAEDVLGESLRYWRLRFLLAGDAGDVPDSIPPAADTPYGNSVAPDAPAHRNREAIDLAARVDVAVRELARLDAATLTGEGESTVDVWDSLVPLLDLFPPPSTRHNATLSMMGHHKLPLMQIVVSVAARYGDGLPQLLSDVLARRFTDQPQQWSPGLRLDLAESLQSSGATAPWYEETLPDREAKAPFEDTYSRLGTVEDLIKRYSRAGDSESVRRLVMSMIPMAFGIGYRKDYQLDAWGAWLGRALLEPEGGRFVAEAAWLARLVTSVEPMTEGAPRSAAASLPPLVVPADAKAAVRIFEYFVRHGTVGHLTALTSLLSALVRRLGAGELPSVELAADLTGELIAPAANAAYPELATALVAAADRATGGEKAAEIAKSVANRTDSYALRTTRSEWRRGLGLPAIPGEPKDGSSRSTADDYGALVLSDGRRIPPDEVGSLVETADDIVTLRKTEESDSHFRWDAVVNQHSLTSDDVLRLSHVFDDDPRRHADVLATLAEASERNGDREAALQLASLAFAGAPGDAWARYGGGARRRAAAVTVRLGGPEQQVAVCHDLVRQAISNHWVPRTLLFDSEDIVDALDPTLPASSVWPEIRIYLNGMAETLDLGDADVLIDHGCRWWLLPRTSDRRAPSGDFTPAAALAELAVGHLSHPSSLIRDAATTTVIRALNTGNAGVPEALARFALPGASDDILERAGRCLAGARSREGFVTPSALDPLESTLATHSSQVLRDLAAHQPPRPYRALHAAYGLQLPSAEGSEPVFPEPYVPLYKILAGDVGLDVEALLAVATSYRRDALGALPEQEAVVRALEASGAKHRYTLEGFAASRAAFGRVVADLRDAGLLEGAPPHVLHLLRSVDIDILHWAPVGRPDMMPEPPTARVDKTVEVWQAGIQSRIDEYVASSTRDDRVVIGAKSRLAILNWGHLEENFTCGMTVGTAQQIGGRILSRHLPMVLRDLVMSPEMAWPQSGEPLVLENEGFWFHDVRGYWLAFRPDLAASLSWTPDMTQPGRWHTASGELAAETIYWVDGWWGRSGQAFDDTQADGHAVVLTASGLREVTTAFGGLTRHFELRRTGRDDGVEAEAVSATRHIPVPPPDL